LVVVRDLASVVEWERPGVLDLDGLELIRVETEELEDGRGDLRRLDPTVDDLAAVNRSASHDNRHIPVLGIVPAVLGDLLLFFRCRRLQGLSDLGIEV
jgi:hypothetical protein